MSKTTHAGYCRPSSQLRQASRLVLGGSTALGLIGATLLAPSAPAAAASSTSASSSASPSTSLSRSTAHSTARAGSPGAQSVHDSLFPSIGNGGYDALHYDIALRYAATSKSITARSTMTARATKKLSRFSLDLEKLTVSSVRVNHTAAKFSRHDAKLVITPRRAVSGRFTVSVSYHGKPVTHIDPDKALDGWIPTKDGATVLSEPLGAQTWFPNNNTPRDKATFRVAVSAPSSLAVAGNGDLAGKRRHGSATTWTWRQSKPMASYLAMISIGKYDVYHSTMRTSTGRKLPIWSFVDPALGSGKKQRDLIPQIIRYHEKNFGPYPFTSVGIVVKETGAGYALETQNRPTFDGLPDTLTEVHELAHQWYGDSVTAKRWEDIWLHEGFADYSERLWTAAHGGPTTKAQFLQTYRANDADATLWTPAPARFSDPADLFGDPVYTRGGMTLEALRLKVGDRAFFTILKRWAAQKRYGTVTTGQFIALSEKVSGKNLDGLFAAWLYVAKKPAGY